MSNYIYDNGIEDRIEKLDIHVHENLIYKHFFTDLIAINKDFGMHAMQVPLKHLKERSKVIENYLFTNLGYDANTEIVIRNEATPFSICYNPKKRQYILNPTGALKGNIDDLLIHRLAHQVVHDFGLCGEFGRKKNVHTLEFALVNYCLLHAVLNKKDRFLIAEDLIDDEYVYKNLTISMARFDKFITEIEFDSIEQLAEVVKERAEHIRKKYCTK